MLDSHENPSQVNQNGEPVFSARARQRNDVKNTKNTSEFVVWEKISRKFIVAEVFLLF